LNWVHGHAPRAGRGLHVDNEALTIKKKSHRCPVLIRNKKRHVVWDGSSKQTTTKGSLCHEIIGGVKIKRRPESLLLSTAVLNKQISTNMTEKNRKLKQRKKVASFFFLPLESAAESFIKKKICGGKGQT
jgi:hypothetical protein